MYYRRVINFHKTGTNEKIPIINDQKRRKVLKAIVSLLSKNPEKTTYIFLAQPPLLYSNDFHWMIERLEETTLTEEKKIWSKLIHRIHWMYGTKNVDQLNAIISASEKEPVLYEEFGLKPIQLNSQRAQKLKEEFKQKKQFEETSKKDTNKGPSPSKQIDELLKKFDSGNLSAWWKISNIIVEEDKNQDHIEGIIVR